MEDLTKEIIAHTGCQNVEFKDGVYFIHFLQHDRNLLRNIRTDGTDMNPVLYTTPENRVRTFYLHDNGSDLVTKLITTPVVFCVTSQLNDGINGSYEHWTIGGTYLHRDGGPAYLANYLNAEGTIATMMSMYFNFGVRKRSGGPSLELYQNYKHETNRDGDPVIRFNQAIFECTYCPGEGDSTETMSWPYVQRLTLSKGREMNVDGHREIAAKFANAKWSLPMGLNSGIYPIKMEMKGFHEFWEGTALRRRRVENVRSTWVRVNEEDRVRSPATLRNGGISHPMFDKQLHQQMEKFGLIEKPFYDDPIFELGVLTDLPKFLGDEND